MPVVELAVIAAFETRAAEAKRLDIVAVHCPDNGRRDLRSVGNAIGRSDLALQGGGTLQFPHDTASLLCIALSTPTTLPTGTIVKRFMTIDCPTARCEKFRPSRDRQSGRSSAEIESD